MIYIKKKRKQFAELTIVENPEKYLELKQELSELSTFGFYDSREEFIDRFWCCTKMDFEDCEHEIWRYCGSYMIIKRDEFKDRVFELKCDDENHKKFSYNKYQCLECEKIIREKDYKKFEEEHLVLKMKGDDIALYILEYINLLMEHPVEKSQNTLIKKYGVKR